MILFRNDIERIFEVWIKKCLDSIKDEDFDDYLIEQGWNRREYAQFCADKFTQIALDLGIIE